jgi:hypothetical protein
LFIIFNELRLYGTPMIENKSPLTRLKSHIETITIMKEAYAHVGSLMLHVVPSIRLFKRKRDSWFQDEGRLAIIGAEFWSHLGNVG